MCTWLLKSYLLGLLAGKQHLETFKHATRYAKNLEFDELFNTQVREDAIYLEGTNDYAPVVFPGFSWANLQNDSSIFNQIPRECGNFFAVCYAVYLTVMYFRIKPIILLQFNIYSCILQCLTKLMKVQQYSKQQQRMTYSLKVITNPCRKSETPSDASFLYLDVDGCTMSNDYYLTLAGYYSGN